MWSQNGASGHQHDPAYRKRKAMAARSLHVDRRPVGRFCGNGFRPLLHLGFTFAGQIDAMSRLTVPLTARIFVAVSATALLVVAIMAIMVAISMRDGFSRYLLQGEINRFDDLVLSLTNLHVQDPAGWEQFRADPKRWKIFVGENFRPLGRPPSAGEPPAAGQRPPAGRRGDPLQVSERLYLLDANGAVVIAGQDRGSASVERPIYASDGQTVIGSLGLTTPEDAVEGIDAFFIKGQYTSLVLAALLAFALSLAVALVFARGVLAPIKALEAGARTLASGHYGVRIPNNRTDELGDLIGHYNVLAETLEAAEAAERRWISNTSHELQTPLTILRAEIEAVQDGVRQPDARTLGEMHGAVMRLSQLVQDLKTLSFTRERQFVTTLAPRDLAQIAKDAADSMGQRADQANLRLRCDIPGPLIALCDVDRIRQVMDNLIENALRYTTAPGDIVISGAKADGVVTLAIDDTAPAPPIEALPHLFERFYRAEKSRSRTEGGSGLGLSICEVIIQAHGGTISAAPSPLGGLRMEIRLPEKGPSNV
jgi:two-component system, OmpR family, sensor histidine kinase BaeS